MEQYKKLVEDNLKDLDIGILYLNAGGGAVSLFQNLSNEELEFIIRLNLLHVFYLLKALINKQLARDKQSGVMITSSGLGEFPCCGVLTYSGCKSAVSNLAMGLSKEYEGKNIDFVAF